MKTKLYACKWLVLCIFLFIVSGTATFGQQVAKTIPYAGAVNGIIGFLEFKPSDYGSQKHPLIIFMHGIGERGDGTTQINNVAANGIANLCSRGATMRFTVGGQTSSFVVLSPQLNPSYGAWQSFYVKEMIKYAKANLQIDTNRIYVTGLSLGGGGAWVYAFESLQNSQAIAALAPVCGTDDGWDANACASAGAANLPIWAFHCKDDGTVAWTNTNHVQLVLNWNCGAMTPAPRFTYYLSGGHSGAWNNAYDTGHITRSVDSSQVKTGASTNIAFTANPNLYEWFLMNSRGPSTGNTPPTVSAGSTQTITLPTSSVSLTGTASGTNGATISTYAWTQTSGPNTASVTTAGNAATTVTGLIQGSYVFTLTVTDNHGLTNSATVTITVNAAPNTPPTVSAGSTQTIILPLSVVTLTGTASGTNGATISSYSWAQTGGPVSGVILLPGLASTSVTGLLLTGTYTFTLTATDNHGLSNSASVTVSVNPANTPPTVSAGSDQSITLPTSSVSLSGSGTGTNGATISTYAWTQTSGPNTASITTAGNAGTTVTSLVQGTYVFTLTVTDNHGLTNNASVTITVNPANTPPTVSAGGNQTIVLPTSSASLTGSGAGTNGATISTYAWTQTSGPNTASITTAGNAGTTVTGLVQGTYVFTLTVTDNHGLANSASVTIIVNPAAMPPNVSAGSDQSVTLPTNAVTLTGTASGNNGAVINTYAWSQNRGPSAAGISTAGNASTPVTGLVQGVYVFTLTVTDNNGLSNSASVTITVNPANTAPGAYAGSDQIITLPTSSVTLSGSGTGTNGATISTYAWTQTSGPNTAGIGSAGNASTTVTGLVQGTYVFTLTVTDNHGLTNSASVTITVNPANTAPTVSAGSDQSITLPTNSVSLSGSGAGTNGATISMYAWTQTSGPNTAGIGSAGNASTTVTGLVQGTYVFTLTVTDNHGLTNSASVTIMVNPANTPPTVSAGSDQSITLPVNSVTLTGTASGTNGAIINTYTWSQTSGPSVAGITAAGNASTTVTGLAEGVYVFTLTVADNKGLGNSASVTITVNPAVTAPVANAGGDQTITLPVNSVTLSGSGTGTNGASISGYAWTQTSGPNTAGIAAAGNPGTAVTGLVQGTYVFTLTVTDNHGLTGSASVTITVNPANTAPVANAGSNQTITLPTSSVTLSGSGTGTNGATISTYAWTQTSGPNTAAIASAGNAGTTVNGLIEGVYVFTLTVTDNHGLTASATVSITVNPVPNTPPVANAGNDTAIVQPASSVTLNGSGSYDPDGSIVRYSWNRIGGTGALTILYSNTTRPIVVGLQTGVYIFELTVTDNKGATATDQVQVTVNPSNNKAPMADAGTDTSISLPFSGAILNGKGSKDPDGYIAAYSWSQLSGPAPAYIAYGSDSLTAVTNLQEGQYVFKLTVTDNEGSTDTATVKVTVVNTFRYSQYFKIYPNPVSATMQLEYIDDKTGKVKVNIFDEGGKLVLMQELMKDQSLLSKQLDVSALKQGSYFIQIEQSGGIKMIRPFIKL